MIVNTTFKKYYLLYFISRKTDTSLSANSTKSAIYTIYFIIYVIFASFLKNFKLITPCSRGFNDGDCFLKHQYIYPLDIGIQMRNWPKSCWYAVMHQRVHLQLPIRYIHTPEMYSILRNVSFALLHWFFFCIFFIYKYNQFEYDIASSFKHVFLNIIGDHVQTNLIPVLVIKLVNTN